MVEIENLFCAFCEQNGVSPTLSYAMPVGYETAFGTYDVCVNTLFINRQMLQKSPEYEVLFAFFHELRHVLQYLRPQLFSHAIVQSLPYVVLYNGTCYRLYGKQWRQCVLEGSEEYFTDAYLGLPYELDANEYAYHTVEAFLGQTRELDALYASWLLKREFTPTEYQILFDQIDQHTA